MVPFPIPVFLSDHLSLEVIMMARPKKQTVDYFPHHCNHKKTMYIIEQRYGNDGYAFWFKLLELLGATEEHYLNLNDAANWEFLQAKTLLSASFCTEILDLLAKLGAIDPALWEEKAVWCQNFVEGIADVYKNRRVAAPVKPDAGSFHKHKTHPADVSTGEKPQSKVNESKVKENKEEILSPAALSTAAPFDHIVSLYHSFCPALPKLQRLTDKRKKTIRARWRADPDLEKFKLLFNKAQASDFLTGRDGKWTNCNFDWLMHEHNMLKVLEGNYDTRAPVEIRPENVQNALRLVEKYGGEDP